MIRKDFENLVNLDTSSEVTSQESEMNTTKDPVDISRAMVPIIKLKKKGNSDNLTTKDAKVLGFIRLQSLVERDLKF